MSRERTVQEKVGDWKEAYDLIRAEITPEQFRGLQALVSRVNEETYDPAVVHLGMDVSRIVFANDRTAAEVAAELTKYSVKHEAPI